MPTEEVNKMTDDLAGISLEQQNKKYLITRNLNEVSYTKLKQLFIF